MVAVATIRGKEMAVTIQVDVGRCSNVSGRMASITVLIRGIDASIPIPSVVTIGFALDISIIITAPAVTVSSVATVSSLQGMIAIAITMLGVDTTVAPGYLHRDLLVRWTLIL
jgi:hypothetical protein